MARKSAAARMLVTALAAVAAWNLASSAFVAAPMTRVQTGAAVAGAVALAPLPALAVEQTYDGFGAPELVAIFTPIFFVWFAYLEWESKQAPTDDVTGVGTLGKTVDAPIGAGGYERRSPEFE